MNLLSAFFSAFEAGKELSNAVTWKKGQVAVAKLSVLLGSVVSIAAAFGYTINLTSEQLVTIAGAVVAIVGLYNGAATVVSTTRIGLPPRDSDDVPGTADGVRDGSSEVGSRDWVHELDDRDSFPVSDMRDRG